MNKITGKVIHGLARGRRLGFPTANLSSKHNLEEGIYLAYSWLRGERIPTLLFVGAARTFGNTDMKTELYFLDYKKEESITGENVRVDVLKKIRANIKFDSAGALITQMKKDEESARRYFNRI